MAVKNFSPFLFLLLFILVVSLSESQPLMSSSTTLPGGTWRRLQSSIGISAMHMQLLHNNKIIIFDRTDFGPSNLSLPANHCRNDPNDVALKIDCTAHSLLYDIPTNTIRPLVIQTDTWCSSGSVLPNGTLVQTGGYNDGDRVVRTLSPCDDDLCDWIELPSYLTVRRWYASNQILPDGRIIVVGGRRVFSYEFYPRNLMIETSLSNYKLGFLQETRDYYDENNLYPFLHLLPDGNLFIFANTRSILFDYSANRILKEYPVLPGDDKRNYPSTGSSVLLPIRLTNQQTQNETQSPEIEVLVCGGAPPGAFYQALHGTFVGASRSCGRIKVTDQNPVWVMEDMPMGRVMSDMLLLPTGDVILINGASNGTAGWECADNPVLSPLLYQTYEPDPTRRFHLLNPSPTPRLYHSAAVLLPDGRILVGGSNPHVIYNFTNVLYPTELSLEAYSPHYLAPEYSQFKPTVMSVSSKNLPYRGTISVTIYVPAFHEEQGVSVSLLAPSFTTHSYAMNQRLVMLNVVNLFQLDTSSYQVSVAGPVTSRIAPPGYYMMFIVHVGVPSEGIWVKVE
ncbi:(methyl)glyoxal oxidase [Ranunculus cassubicifolius]